MKSYTYSALVGLLAVLLLPACFPAIQLYQGASADFSSGAEKEMKDVLTTRFENAPAEAVPTLSQVLDQGEEGTTSNLSYTQLYQSALEKLDKALKKKGALQESDVLGNALTVKALAAWKLKRYEEADAAATEAEALFKTQEENSPRDEVLAQAVHSLITLDMVYDSTHDIIEDLKSKTNTASDLPKSEALSLFDNFKEAYAFSIQNEEVDARCLLNALTDLDGIRAVGDPEKESVCQFVLLSELTGLKNWYDALFHIDNVMKLSQVKQTETAVKTWITAERDRYDEKRTSMMEELLELLGGSEDHPTYAFWDGKL
ncbi:MAG: hypothetical protein KTR30_04930 [Saprospiraceae bacterium]|nr:hypothetical protein [Saprospiraceae bacterium]